MRRNATRSWRRLRARMLAASTTCGICGHEGSDAIDHIIPLARGGTDDPRNLQPAHHVEPCPTCGRKCNREKSDREWAPIVRDSGSIKRPTTQGDGPHRRPRGSFSA